MYAPCMRARHLATLDPPTRTARHAPGRISVAGQGLQRREILRIIAVAAVASHFPGFSRWAYAEAHAHAAGDAPRPTIYTPQFFTVEEFAIITRLTDDLHTFVGSHPQHDDITLIVIRKK